MNNRLLAYPFDANLIMRKAKALRRDLSASANLIEKRIAVLGGSTTHDVIAMLELFLLDNGIKPVFYESEYNQWWEDGVFGNAELDVFKPDVVYIHTSVRNVKTWPAIAADAAAGDLAGETVGKWRAVWEKIAEKFKCPVIQNNFEYLPYRLLGNLDAVDRRGRVEFVTRLNAGFAEYARTHDGVYLNDINWQAADFGLARWHDEAYWCMYKYAMGKAAIPVVAFNAANIIKALFGKNKKALALDLDNTLWGGVVGDDGPENLELGTETAVGQCYTEFQEYLKELGRTGVLLNVISKNEPENAKAGMNHPQMVIKEGDFISVKANWEPKSENLKAMARELTLLPESFVFVDDNPAEREIIRQQVPGAAVPEIVQVENYISAVDHGGWFEPVKISGDDLKRNAMYSENAQRAQLQSSFADYGAYLDSLEMKATIKPFEQVYMSRIAQLTNKSNQFNLTTKRYTQEEIVRTAADAAFVTRYGRLEDRFGDNGVVAISIGEMKGDAMELVLWLMSCRVLKRDMEFAMMDEMVAEAKARGAKTVRGFYYPTAKNGMVRNFYATQGFTKMSEDALGNAVWELDIAGGYEPKNRHIKIERS
ncbi:MAG: HAD-IIIC family phosphatase [Kiritimatiellae bacterium]|nr:HAD-IIIC family phosphatase [Kiritimatiellia bacterium]